MNKQTIYDIDAAGKTVYVRVDYNVPCDKDGHITDDRRIRSTLPTIRYLLKEGAAVILASHMGRPKGELNPELSLRPAAERLSELLDQPVQFADDCIGSETAAMKKALQPGQVLLLENLRFHKEEEKNDPDFAKALVEGCTAAVNDAFGVSHRAHASVVGVGKLLPMVSGLLLKKEIDFLDGVIENPKRPFAAIIGGAKISDKIQVIANLMEKADVIMIGGGMANTFVAAEGYDMGRSLQDKDRFDFAAFSSERRQNRNLATPFVDQTTHPAVDIDRNNDKDQQHEDHEHIFSTRSAPKNERLYSRQDTAVSAGKNALIFPMIWESNDSRRNFTPYTFSALRPKFFFPDSRLINA